METKMRPSTKPVALSIAVAAALAGLQAQAAEQTSTTPEQKPEEAERIVITGSLIRRDAFGAEQPVEIIKAEDAALQGITNVGELLRSITIASGSPQITSAISSEFVSAGGTGVETLSLRGLGANRTLVLLNGRRAGPAGTRGEVAAFDFNVLPISMVERVEVLKDGASSLYGSDAIAGVVNIITKKGDGGEVNVFTSQPEESGGESTRISATWGTSTENASMRFVVDHNVQKELARGQRDFFNCGERYIFDPTTGARKDPIDPRTNKYHCSDLLWGHVWIYDYADPTNVGPGAKAQYDYDGNLGNWLTPFPNTIDPNNPGHMVTPAGWFPVAYDRNSDAVTNADHPFQDLQTLIPENERTSVYGQANYDFSNGMTAYGEVLINRRKTTVNGYRQFWGYVTNTTFDPFGTGTDELSTGWAGDQWLSPTPITDHSGSQITVDYQRYVAGMKGDIGEWFWDASYQVSRSEGEYRTKLIYKDAVQDQDFLPVSCVGMNTSVRGVPCKDIPWLDPQFLRGNISQEMRAFLFGEETGKTVYDQASLDVVFSGDLFTLDTGPVGMAVGVHYRTDEINDKPGEQTLLKNAWGATAAGITKGDDTTEAIFAEVKVPLLADLPMVQNLELSVSGRYTDVDSSGSADTYKASILWEMTDTVRLRASKGTSFRAPALFELYLADQTSFASQRSIDPCIRWGQALADGRINQRIADNCAADGIANNYAGGAITAEVFTGGGYGILEPETSEAVTYGIVWTPKFANLNVAIDYFDFKIDGEVTQLGAAALVRQCYNSEFFPNEPLCNQFDRAALDNRIETVRDQFINIATQRNRGYDLSIDYRTDFSFGRLTIQSRSTLQEESSRALFPGTEVDSNGELGDPEFTSSLNTTMAMGDWSVTWGMQYFDKVSDVDRIGSDRATYRGEQVRLVLGADSVMYHSLSVTRDFADMDMRLTFGVANLEDKRPPRISTYSNDLQTVGDSAFYSQYDFVGRRMFADLTWSF